MKTYLVALNHNTAEKLESNKNNISGSCESFREKEKGITRGKRELKKSMAKLISIEF